MQKNDLSVVQKEMWRLPETSVTQAVSMRPIQVQEKCRHVCLFFAVIASPAGRGNLISHTPAVPRLPIATEALRFLPIWCYHWFRRLFSGRLNGFWRSFTLIQIKHLSLSFGERVILKDIKWLIGEGSRIGLVGDNGAGKTTLLRILAGEIEPDDGRVDYVGAGNNVAIGYLPQDLQELGGGRVIDFLRDKAELSGMNECIAKLEEEISRCGEGSPDLARLLGEHERLAAEFSHRGGYEFEATATKVLRGLGFTHGDAERATGEFSGGWKMRLALAGILLRRPDVLLLDEPTNHLDSESMEWLEGWLRDHRGVMIFVSHDRRFLGKMANEIAELARGAITRYSMGYDAYLVERDAARERLERTIEDQKERIEQMQRFIDRFRYKATKATQVQSRIKQLEKMEIYEMDAPSKHVNIRFPEAARSGHEVISGHGLSKSYGQTHVFSDLDVEIYRGQRVALVGVNGAGKSTLLRLLSGTEKPDTGAVKLGHNVRSAYFSQESAQNLNYAHTVWEEACRTGSKITEAEKRNLLGSFLFSGDDIKKPIRVLSGGEKSRVALFKLLLSDSNFLILDEPTNHLDMATREMFQRALLQYGGTLLIVSHDRFFLDNLVDRVLEIRDGRLFDYPGNYSYFVDRRERMLGGETVLDAPAARLQQIARAEGNASPTPLEPIDGKEQKRAEAERRNTLYRKRKVFADRIAPLEEQIETAEARLGEVDALLCDAEVLADSSRVQDLMIERRQLEEAIAADYEIWEELSSAMEAVGR